MDRVNTASKEEDKFGPGKPGFTEGDPQAGVEATVPGAEWFDNVQEDLMTLIEVTDRTPGSPWNTTNAVAEIVRNFEPEYTEESADTHAFFRTHTGFTPAMQRSGRVGVTRGAWGVGPSATHQIESPDMPDGMYWGVVRTMVINLADNTKYYVREQQVLFQVDKGSSSQLNSQNSYVVDGLAGVVSTPSHTGTGSKFRCSVTIGAAVGTTYNIIVDWQMTKLYCEDLAP